MFDLAGCAMSARFITLELSQQDAEVVLLVIVAEKIEAAKAGDREICGALDKLRIQLDG